MGEYAFSKYHPIVNLIFFVGAFFFSVMLQHPLYIFMDMLMGVAYFIILNGKTSLKKLCKLFVLFIFLTIINPLLNIRGDTVLFKLMGRPYTFEALIYGVVLSAIFVITLIWLDCYGKILTGDKFACLFSNIMPMISLLLVMVFRLIPNLIDKINQIYGARNAIGKGLKTENQKGKIKNGLTVLGVVTTWALENSVVTGDSMKARGYGADKRSSFMVYRMRKTDWIMLVMMIFLIVTVSMVVLTGGMTAIFVPKLKFATVRGNNLIGFVAYCIFLIIPIAIHIKEKILWSISKYRI